MNRTVTGNRLKALGSALALLLVTLILAVGLGETGAAPAADNLVWVRQADPVINVNNDPTFWEAPEGDRFEGSFWEVFVDETAITYEERFVDHGYEYYIIMLRSEFDQPPRVLYPAQPHELTAYASHDAAKAEGAGGIGFQFWYDSNGAAVDPHEVLAYYPWFPDFTGLNSKEWRVSAPEPRQEGDTFQLWASWWNCPPCNVTWTYKAEPANEVEQLGVEVIAPVVTYQGEEVPPGETVYPESCAAPGGRMMEPCKHDLKFKGDARAYGKCIAGSLDQVLILLQRARWSEYNDWPQELVVYVADAVISEHCDYLAPKRSDYRLDLALVHGGMLIDQVVIGQKTRVITDLATAVAGKPGSFAAAYNPASKTAVFQSFSAPLVIETQSGGSLTLPPAHKVELTEAGFGPVTTLPHLYLPVQMR